MNKPHDTMKVKKVKPSALWYKYYWYRKYRRIFHPKT